MFKYVLGFNFDGNPGEHTIWITKQRRDDILTALKKWVREGEDTKGIPLDEFRRYTSKLMKAFIYIPAGKGFLLLCNQFLGKELPKVYLNRNKPLLSDIQDVCHLLKFSTEFPTPCKELIIFWHHYIGVKDSSSHGVGGIIVAENKACVPTIFFAWPEDIQELHRKEIIRNSDLECAGLLLLCFIIEEVCP